MNNIFFTLTQTKQNVPSFKVFSNRIDKDVIIKNATAVSSYISFKSIKILFSRYNYTDLDWEHMYKYYLLNK